MLSVTHIYFILTIMCLSKAANVFFNSDNAENTCKLPDGSERQCIAFESCPEAIKELKNGKRPQTCGFNNEKPLVCCKKEIQSEPKNMPGYISELQCKEPLSGKFTIVVGGTKSLAKEFPHMAALGFGDEANIKWACGGSLISKTFVLTAAHCLFSKDIGNVKFVRLGDLNLKRNDDVANPQNFTVRRAIAHPNYKPPSQYNDIALLEIDRPANYNNFVKPACLQLTNKIPVSDIIATGWGKVMYQGETSDHLQKVTLAEVAHNACKRSYAEVSPRRLANGIIENQLCAGHYGKDTCQGDSGGPLQYYHENYTNFMIVGITSFGKACGVTSSPGVYTRVSSYLGWVESVVWPN